MSQICVSYSFLISKVLNGTVITVHAILRLSKKGESLQKRQYSPLKLLEEILKGVSD